jgi:hypothetical protein
VGDVGRAVDTDHRTPDEVVEHGRDGARFAAGRDHDLPGRRPEDGEHDGTVHRYDAKVGRLAGRLRVRQEVGADAQGQAVLRLTVHEERLGGLEEGPDAVQALEHGSIVHAADDATLGAQHVRATGGHRSRRGHGTGVEVEILQALLAGELARDVAMRDVDELVDVERPDTDAVSAG